MKALIDSGAQILAILESMVKTLGLPFRQLRTLLHLEGAAGLHAPYLGYTELRLDIPEIKRFDHDCLMMIYPDSKYSHRVPIIIGTLHIDEVLDLATEKEQRVEKGSCRMKSDCETITISWQGRTAHDAEN